MRILTTALLSAGLMMGTASIAHAQLGALKDAASKAATDAAKDKASGLLGTSAPAPSPLESATSGLLGNNASTSGLGNVASGVAGNSTLGSITSSDLSGDETLTAGKILLGGGSTTDVATTIAKDRAKAQGKDLLNQQIGSVAGSLGSGTQYEEAPAATQGSGTSYQAPAAAVNCPSGTTAQADGSCMITGNWGG